MSSIADTNKLDYTILEQAADWFALFESEEVDAQQRQAWQAWLDADENNRRAWQQVETISKHYVALPTKSSMQALDASEINRRELMKKFAVLLVVGGALWQTARWQHVGASYKTARGEIANFTLKDGTRLWLNTSSAVNVTFNQQQRQIELLAGEILIDTAKDKRAFYVNTQHGKLEAIGTRFTVRDLGKHTYLGVEEGAVAIKIDKSSKPVFVKHGYATQFNRTAVDNIITLKRNSSDWTRKMIVANETPLGEFITDLNRYYSGYINVSPDVAGLKLVGAYPLDDIERILNAIEQYHPVTISRVTPWWRSVHAAD